MIPWLTERQPDDVPGKPLQKSMEDRGPNSLIGAETQELVGGEDGRVNKIGGMDDSEVDTDLVVMAVASGRTRSSPNDAPGLQLRHRG